MSQLPQLRPLRLITLGRVELVGAGDEGTALNRRRRKLAVLALLALEPGGVARDRLLEMFWGAHPESRARHSLSDAISHLRRVLGAETIITGQDRICLAPEAPLVVDALELEAAVQRSEWARAVALHGGAFLAGVAVAGSHTFEEWAAREDRRLRSLVSPAYAAVADAHAARGEWDDAVRIAGRWVEAAPESLKARRFLERATTALAALDPVGGAPAELPAPLRELWLDACAGRGQLALISGPSEPVRCVIAALGGAAREQRAAVIAVRAYGGEERTPRRLLREVVAQLAETPGFAGTDPACLAALAAVAPEVSARFVMEPGRERSSSMAAAVRGAIESVAFESPLLLLLQDGHLADGESRAALFAAVSEAAGPVLMVVTTSSDATGVVAPLPAAAMHLPLANATHRSDSDPTAANPVVGPRPIARRLGVRRFAAACMAAVVLLGVGLAAVRREPALLAVGIVEDRTGGDSSGTALVLPELLATSLSRVEGIRVLSRARLHQGLAATGATAATAASVSAAARVVGATELLEGALYRREGKLRLELRRVSLRSGVVQQAVSSEGSDAFELAEAISAALAPRGVQMPSTPLHEVTSTSMLARRFYEEGLRAYFAGAKERAGAFFDAALREDSTFAMSAHYAALIRGGGDHRAVRRAVRLAANAPDRERLLVHATWLLELNDPRGSAVAETLAVRYPDELAGAVLFARTLIARGDFSNAVGWLNRTIAQDSLALSGGSAVCHACEALRHLKAAALLAGSLEAAERAMSRIAAAHPDGGARSQAWEEVALVRSRRGDAAGVHAAIDSADRYNPGRSYDHILLDRQIRAGLLQEAEHTTRNRLQAAVGDARRLWLLNLALILRMQGRYAEALAVAESAHVVAAAHGAPPVSSQLPIAVVELAHDPRRAAVLFDSLAGMPVAAPEFVARNARQRAWMLTHAATAAAASGDSARVKRLADSIQAIGALSDYGRDQRLHHYVRGLLWELRGDTARAVNAYLEARYSSVETYLAARLARGQLALGMPRAAVGTAEAALAGPLDSQNQYESRTELHEVLGDAYLRMGNRAKAREHLLVVSNAWSAGDPRWSARAQRARSIVSRLPQS